MNETVLEIEKPESINSEVKNLEKIAKDIRKKIFLTIYNAGSGHIAPAFSCVELMVALYYKTLNVSANNIKSDNRDRFVLGKGHACVGLYTILAEKGIIDKNELKNLCKPDCILGGHPESHLIPGVEMSTGSLGHGLSYSAGLAYAGKMDNKDYRVFTLLSDGECQEGSIWEAIMFASHHKLDNLVAIVDHNKLQSLDRVENIVSLAPFAERWRAFGWDVKEINGHNMSEVTEALSEIPFSNGKPSVIIANTIKGKGISFMESVPIWHYRLPNEEELKIVLKELDIKESELEK